MSPADKALYEFLSAVKRNDLSNVVLLGEAHQTAVKFGYVAENPTPNSSRPLLLTESGFSTEAGLGDHYPQWHVTCLDGRRLYLRKIVVDEDGSSFFAYTDRADKAKVFSLLDARGAAKDAAEFKGVRHNITGA